MTAFVAAGSLLMAISLFWLLRPIRMRGDSGGARRTGWALVAVVPAAAIAIYAVLGRFDALTPLPEDADRERVEAMVARLAARLADEPHDVAGWRRLALSYEQLRRFPDAVRAHVRLTALRPDDAAAFADLAEAVSQSQGGQLSGEPIGHVRRALQLDPKHPKALALAANEAFQRDDPMTAIGYWERLAGAVPTDSEVGRSLRTNIAKARETLAERGS